MHKTVDEVSENDNKLLLADSISEHDFVEGDADLNSILAYLPERVSCFAHTQQLCIKDCLQDSEFFKSYIGRQLAKVADIVNSIRKSVNATTYLKKNNTTLRAKNVIRWNSQLVMLQTVLKDHEEVNIALALIQSPNRITNQDYLALNELVRVLLPFKEAMQQIEKKNIVTSSSICPVVIGLVKAMEQLKNANLNRYKKLATALHDSVLKRLLPFLNCMDNRLASLLHPRFKQKWIENDDEKEALRVLQMLVTSGLGPFQEDCSSSNSTDDDNGSLAKKPELFDFIAKGSKKKKT